MWPCEICGHWNKNVLEICEAWGVLREEPAYDGIDDAYLDKEEGLLQT